MLTYQVRPHVFRIPDGASLPFPNQVTIEVRFGPDAAFGNKGAPGRTWRQSTPGNLIINANTGHSTIDPATALDELEVTIEHTNMLFSMRGNLVRLSTWCDSNKELTALVESMYYALPLMLTLELGEAVVVDRVSGTVGEVAYGWELAATAWQPTVLITSQDEQEKRVVRSWELMDFAARLSNRRLLGALRYFHTACRLRRAGHTPWEFMGEILLNLSKVLEVLFPATCDAHTQDFARRGLAKLDYTESEIESFFVPVILLRNKIDVGHVRLSLFTPAQLQVLHEYAEATERLWRDMLQRLVERLRGGQFHLSEHDLEGAPPDVASMISRMSDQLSQRNAP